MKNMKRTALSILSLTLAIMMVLPMAITTGSALVTLPTYEYGTIFDEDHGGSTNEDAYAAIWEEMIKNNDTTNKWDGKSPINNLYDQTIVGTGYTEFKEFTIDGKALNLIGNHQSETTSKNVFSMTNNGAENAGKGFVTVVPKSAMAGLEGFTVSYIERQYKPNNASFGLALFYQATTISGVDYFNGYDNYTFTGFTGKDFGKYAAYSVYGNQKTEFETETMITKPAKNKSVFVSVTCTKGDFTFDGKNYTAKIESYVDDQLVATSYAQWVDAPIMLYIETSASDRFDVQFTNINVRANHEVQVPAADALLEIKPLRISGTAVRWMGGAGLRFYTELDKEVAFSRASKVETGVILQPVSEYTGFLDLNTFGILKSETARVVSEDNSKIKHSHAFTDPAKLEGKTFYARGYVQYEIENETVTYYTPIEKASCVRTAAKVLASIPETRSTKPMLDACTVMTGGISTINVMSFNALSSAKKTTEKYGELTLEARTAAAIAMFLDMKPDVVGLQEASDAIIALYRANTELMAMYDIVGTGEHKESGEGGLYIMYNKQKYELVKEGTKYLSETPDTPHSLFPEAVEGNLVGCQFYPRKANYAVLKDKTTSAEFAYVNTHLSYDGKNEEKESIADILRLKQANKLVELISNGSMFDSAKIPFLIGGDMNSKPNSDPYNSFMSITTDLRYIAKTAPEGGVGTLHSYEKKNVMVDHIFVVEDVFYPSSYEIVKTEYNNILPSDHYAVLGSITVLPD